MSALSGVLAGLVAGFMIAWRNWYQWWADRDVERLYQVLLGLSRFRAVIPYCEYDPPEKSMPVYLADPVFRICENAQVLHNEKYKDLANRLTEFAESNLQFGASIVDLSEEERNDKKDKLSEEVERLLEEVTGILHRTPFRSNPFSCCKR